MILNFRSCISWICIANFVLKQQKVQIFDKSIFFGSPVGELKSLSNHYSLSVGVWLIMVIVSSPPEKHPEEVKLSSWSPTRAIWPLYKTCLLSLFIPVVHKKNPPVGYYHHENACQDRCFFNLFLPIKHPH